MPKRLDGKFTIYEFTDEEILQAVTLSPLQEAYIQTLLAMVMTDKMNIAVDISSKDPAKDFMFQHEYLRGSAEQLQFILGGSADNKDRLKAFLEKQKESQTNDLKPTAAT